MNKIWHKYPDTKPDKFGYYAVAERYGNLSTFKYDTEDDTYDEPCFLSPAADKNVRYWAELDDILPHDDSVRNGHMYKNRYGWDYRYEEDK